MIYGISGPERSGKDLLGVKIAIDRKFDYPILQGFGNMHIDTPYPFEYMETAKLLELMGNYIRQGRKNSLFYISEADRFLSPRMYKEAKQTASLTGVWQGEKMKNVFVYNFHPGDPEERLLGVDLLLRSSTSIKIKIIRFYKEQWALHYSLRNVMLLLKPVEMLMPGLDKYKDYYDHEEPVI